MNGRRQRTGEEVDNHHIPRRRVTEHISWENSQGVDYSGWRSNIIEDAHNYLFGNGLGNLSLDFEDSPSGLPGDDDEDLEEQSLFQGFVSEYRPTIREWPQLAPAA